MPGKTKTKPVTKNASAHRVDVTHLYPNITMRIERIGHNRASELLAAGIGDERKITPQRVREYRDQMLAQEWFVGPPIVIDSNGHVTNGRHRLHAVLEAQTEVDFFVIDGVPAESFYIFDKHRPRNLGDDFSISGINRPQEKASLFICYQHLVEVEEAGKFVRSLFRRNNKKHQVPQAVQWANDNEAALDEILSVTMATRETQAVANPRRIFNALYFRLHQVNAREANKFFRLLIEGSAADSGPKRSDPVYLLRKEIDRLHGEIVSGKVQEHPRWLWAVLIYRAWNAYLEGRPMSSKEITVDLDEALPALKLTRRRNRKAA